MSKQSSFSNLINGSLIPNYQLPFLLNQKNSLPAAFFLNPKKPKTYLTKLFAFKYTISSLRIAIKSLEYIKCFSFTIRMSSSLKSQAAHECDLSKE